MEIKVTDGKIIVDEEGLEFFKRKTPTDIYVEKRKAEMTNADREYHKKQTEKMREFYNGLNSLFAVKVKKPL